jgi:hypothetical protein
MMEDAEAEVSRQRRRKIGVVAVLSLAAVALHGCGPKADTPTPESSAQPAEPASVKPIVTIKELMDSTVDPAADGVWDSVATIVTRAGIDKREPRSDEEWHAVRRHAVTLIEAMNLVIMEGRRAAPPGTKPGLGELSPAQIDTLIAAERSEFDEFAEGVRAEAINALKAIDRKDTQALSRVSGDIDARCEACHLTYWYPNAQRPAN